MSSHDSPSVFSQLNRRHFIFGMAMAAVPLLLPSCSSQVMTSDLPMPTGDGVLPPPGNTAAASSATIRRPMPETRSALPSAEPLVRVRLTQADLSRGPVRVAGSGWVRAHQPIAGRLGRVVKAPVTVAMAPRGWEVRDATGVRLNFDGFDILEIAPAPNQPQEFELDGSTYSGTIRFVSRSDVSPGTVDLVNHAMMEQYLPGVIAKELYNNWKPHTHMAQAVAARSYAASEIAYWANRRHFDVVAGQASQAYVGRSEHRVSNDAVRQTRGQVLAYQNLLVTAYYSSCCGGRSASASDAFGPGVINAIAPLEARPLNECCRWAPMYTWRVERSSSDVSRRLSAWALDDGSSEIARLGDVASIEAGAVYQNGRASRYVLRNSRGQSVEIGAERFREAMNYRDRGLGSPSGSLKSADISATVGRSSVTFNGRGFGHGVGLCQHGAEGMARQGTDYRTILARYYPQASIVASYS